jgi:sec-independent protein translocase protein TatB
MGTPQTIQFASLGMADSLILMVLALVVFGPRRLPQIGRQIGKLMYEFRKASNDFKFQMEEELRNAEEADRRKKDAGRRSRSAGSEPVSVGICLSSRGHACRGSAAGRNCWADSAALDRRDGCGRAAQQPGSARRVTWGAGTGCGRSGYTSFGLGGSGPWRGDQAAGKNRGFIP